MTLLEHIYAVRKSIDRGGPGSDDSRISNALIKHYLKIHRITLIQRYIDKDYKLSGVTKQSVCIPLEKSQFHDCSCIPNAECQILKSTTQLPAYITAQDGVGVKVRFLDGREISETSLSSLKSRQYSLTNKNTIQYFIYNRYLYVVGTLSLKGVIFEAVLSNPEKASEFNLCEEVSSVPCYNENSVFPIEQSLINPMYELTLKSLGMTYNSPEDRVNDAQDVNISNAKK